MKHQTTAAVEEPQPIPSAAVASAIHAVEVPTPTPTLIKKVVVPHAPVVSRAKPSNYDGLLQAHFGSSWLIARAVMMAESGGRSDAIGDGHLTYYVNGIKFGYSVGLFQIRQLPGRPSTTSLMSPEFNIRHAAGMWRSQGWKPWSAYKNGAYKRYL